MLQQVTHLYHHPEPRPRRGTSPVLRLKNGVEFGTVFGRFDWNDPVGIIWIELVHIVDEFGLTACYQVRGLPGWRSAGKRHGK